jgi:hypothetical protein
VPETPGIDEEDSDASIRRRCSDLDGRQFFGFAGAKQPGRSFGMRVTLSAWHPAGAVDFWTTAAGVQIVRSSWL